MSIDSINPLSTAFISHHLKENRLTKISDISEIYVNRSFFHKHLAKDRCSLIASPLGRLALTPLNIFLILSSHLTYRIGLKTLSSNLFNYIDLLQNYAISDPSLKPLIRTMNNPLEVDVNERFTEAISGICAGSSLYFNYLFATFVEKQENLSDNSYKELLIKIANVFVKGGPKEARKIHRAYGITFMNTNQFYKEYHPHLLSLIPDDDKSKLKNGIVVYKNRNDIKKLANTTHIVRTFNSSSYHIMSLIKISDTQAYIFDPAIGLFRFDGENIPEQINDYLNSAYKYSHKYYYYRSLRANRSVDSKEEIKPSDIKNLYTEIVPCNSKKNCPIFNSSISENKQRFIRYSLNIWGGLRYLTDSAIDSIKSSEFANFFQK